MTNKEHVHGGCPDVDRERLNVDSNQSIRDFSVNTTPWGPPEILRFPQDLFSRMTSYPPSRGKPVAQFLSDRYQIPEPCLLPTNGSVEGMYHIFRALDISSVLLVPPCFHDYERAASAADVRIEFVKRSSVSRYQFPDTGSIREKLPEVDALFVGHPGNPTGHLLPKNQLEEWMSTFQDTFFLVDEAFISFYRNEQEQTFTSRVEECENVVVFHSLTKFFTIPGLRVGGTAAHPEQIDKIQQHQPPWSINHVASRSAELLLKHNLAPYETKIRKRTREEMNWIQTRLQNITGISQISEGPNYFFCAWNRTDHLDDLLTSLLSKGLYVRDCRNFRGISDELFRFSVRKREANSQLMEALEHA